jgi:4-aminobutyrate--pyruvate transaminase
MIPLSNMAMRDVETVLHPYTNLVKHRETGPQIFNEARGIHVYDDRGKPYIEGVAGLWCASLGYGNEELAEAGAAALRKLSFAHTFSSKSHDGVIELSEKLKAISPVATSKILYACSGSEANDMQIKLTWYMNNALGRPQKKKIISRKKGYHGVTIASGSLTGLSGVQTDFDLPIAGILHTSCPHHYAYAEAGESEADFATRMADDLEAMILREGPDTVAGFIAEPIMGAGGVIMPPETYFAKVAAVLKRYDIRFIVDEVICGFGRTGKMFGCETFGIQAQSVSMAKAITSGVFPLSAVSIEEDLYQAMLEESRKLGSFGHGFTHTAHPVGCALALKTIEIYERDGVVAHAARVGQVFQAHQKALADHPLVGEARGIGLIGALELVADKATRRPFNPKHGIGKRVAAICQDMGLIGRAVGDALVLSPPLIITADQTDEMFAIVTRAFDQLEHIVRQENLHDV